MNIGILGCGAIGEIILEAYKEGLLEDIRITMIYDQDEETSKKCVMDIPKPPRIAKDVADLIRAEDVSLIVESASQKAVKDYALDIIKNKKSLMIMSVGALVDEKFYNSLLEAAKENEQKLYIPSGAIAGIDAIKSASIGKIFQVELTTRKPPSRFISDPLPNGIKIDLNMKEPKVIFEGNAKSAQNLFPRSINVAATLSLASLGPEKTKVIIIADPSIEENIHEIYVKGECGTIRTRVENLPSIKNPKTSYLAALSAIRTLKKIAEHIQIGT